MKKLNIRMAIKAGAVAFSLFAFAAPGFANKKQEVVSASTAINPEVAFIGNDDDGSTFLLSFGTTEKVKYELVVSGVNGDVLYRNIQETGKANTYLKLLNEDGGSDKYNFTIRILPEGKVHTFEVRSNVKVVTNVVVEKQ